ncbi:MAG: class I SAM-dependent methyltransferase family protein [Candidatus Bathyarchaeia archaeon]
MANVVEKKSTCLKVLKNFGEKAIILANKLEIVDKELEIKRDEAFSYVPLNRQPSEEELKTLREQLPNCEISTEIFHERKRQVAFTDLLEDKLPPHLLASLPRALDFVGDIAIIEIPPELEAYKTLVGEAILKTHKSVQTVLAKVGAVSGTYRLREFSVIAGKPKTETVHKEHGCQFYVDLAKAYFSPRLSYEHNRIASLVKEGETVIDMFSGVGPFAILIAKIHENVKVYAIDMNSHAIEFLQKNIRLNRVEGKVHPIFGDARQVVEEKLLGMADRIIMNLPEKAMEFVDVACKALKPAGGIIHFYTFVGGSGSLENVKLKLIEAVKKCGRKVEVLFSRFVRATAPYEWQAVIDAKIF